MVIPCVFIDGSRENSHVERGHDPYVAKPALVHDAVAIVEVDQFVATHGADPGAACANDGARTAISDDGKLALVATDVNVGMGVGVVAVGIAVGEDAADGRTTGTYASQCGRGSGCGNSSAAIATRMIGRRRMALRTRNSQAIVAKSAAQPAVNGAAGVGAGMAPPADTPDIGEVDMPPVMITAPRTPAYAERASAIGDGREQWW
jgi:hypothetical protein